MSTQGITVATLTEAKSVVSDGAGGRALQADQTDIHFHNNKVRNEEVFRVRTRDPSDASAALVNWVEVAPGKKGSGVTITAAGADANIDIDLLPKGTGALNTSNIVSDTIEATTEVKTDAVNESTALAGVTVDGVLIKDTSLSFDGGANTLDAFESRTSWTPTVDSLGGFTGTPAILNGYYCRIGPIVFCSCIVTGLTAAATSLNYFRFTVPISTYQGATVTSGGGRVVGNVTNERYPENIGDWTSGTSSTAAFEYNSNASEAVSCQVNCWYWAA